MNTVDVNQKINIVDINQKTNTAEINQKSNTLAIEKINIQPEHIFLQVQYPAEIVKEVDDA